MMKSISNDKINVHKFNDPKLPQDPTTYQTGKYIECYFDKVWYIGVIFNTWVLKWKSECKIQIHEPKRINFAVVNDAWSSQSEVLFTKVICEISPPPFGKRTKCSRLCFYNERL